MSSLTHSSRVSSGRLAVTAACWLVSAIIYGAGVPGAYAELAAVGSNYDSQLGFSETVRVTPAPAMMGNVIAMAGNNGGLSSDETKGTTLAVKADGTVWGWGGNSSGLLGPGQPSTCVKPVKIPGLSGVRSVAVGSYCALALRTDGTVWGWGYNGNGLLGDFNTSGHDMPRPIPGLSSITAISFVGGHALALKSDGTVWAWGYDNKGQLGDNSWFPRCSPVQVLSDATAIAASGASFSMALKSDGTVWVWGNGNYWVPKQYNNPRLINIRSIAAGSAHCLAVTATGIVYGWGENLVAVPVPTSSVNYPSETFFPIVTVSNLTGVAKVAACNDYSLALKSDGTVWAWGANHEGQMADTNSSYHWTPVQIPNLTSIDALAAGYVHCMALRSDGTLWTWGLNNAGQLGRGDRTTTYTGGLPRAPSQVPNSTGYTSVSAGYSHNLAIGPGGTVYAWGTGVLGDGTDSKVSPTPVQVAGLSNVTAVSAGYGHSLALKSDGTVAAWGSYESDYGPSEVVSPRTVNDVNNAVAVAASKYSINYCYYFSLALRSDGTVYAWGNYDWPTPIYGLTGAVAIAAGADFALALKNDGTVMDLTGCPPGAPVQVFSNATAIAAGGKRLALKADGTVWTWDSARTPTQVPGLTDITAISAGYSFSLALRSDGTVWAWGSNEYGQLGDLTNTSRTTPVQVQGIASVTKVEAGAYHALFFGSLQSAVPFVWPPDASCERGIRQLFVRFNQPVSNISVDDLLLSGGGVTGVTGDNEGPYVFDVANIPDGPISATLGGDISVTGGTALAPQTWSFTSGGPNVTQEPATQVGCAGQTFQFAVTATGVSTYQWQKDGVALSDDGHYSGTATPILTVQAATASDLGNYFCVLSGDCTVVAGPAALIFSSLVPTNPVNWPLCLGGSASFPVTITGEASYQWQKDGANLTDNQHFYGTNNSCLSVYNLTTADAGNYSCIVTTNCGTSVLNAGSILSQPFAAVSQPQPQTVCYGGSVTFTFVVSGDGQLTYQWQKNGVSIGDGGGIVSGSRTASLTLSPSYWNSLAGKYRCVVTGPCGTMTSSEAQLTVVNPTITLQPTAQSACPGETVTFTVETSCATSYVWQKNYTSLSDDGRYAGTTTKTLQVLVGDASMIGNYRCLLGGVVASNQAPLTYRSPAPAITQQPQPQSACPGSTAQFTVAATGSNLTYLWYKNAVELQDGGHYSGVTTPILTISDVDSSTFGNYGCMVTGNQCALSVASNAPALSLCTRSVQQWSSVHSHAGTDRGIGVDAATAGTTPIIENRQGGIQKLQVRFNGPVVLANPAAITVLAGQTAFTPQVQVSPTAADTLELNFTPSLPDGACYTVTIGSGVITGQFAGNVSCQVRAMLGDSTGNGAVNLGDALYVQSRIGQSVDSYSWLDIDLSGTIDMADVLAVKAQVTSGAAPFTCP